MKQQQRPATEGGADQPGHPGCGEAIVQQAGISSSVAETTVASAKGSGLKRVRSVTGAIRRPRSEGKVMQYSVGPDVALRSKARGMSLLDPQVWNVPTRSDIDRAGSGSMQEGSNSSAISSPAAGPAENGASAASTPVPANGTPMPISKTAQVSESRRKGHGEEEELWLTCSRAADFGERSVQKNYEILTQVGEGAYGSVYKARNKETNTFVAMKKILVHEKEKEQGFPVAALREIGLMRTLRHKNILSVNEVVSDDQADYVVLPYYDNDLVGIVSNKDLLLGMDYIKCYMKQLLTAVWYLHVRGYMHRDIKTANILVGNDSNLVLADWGFVRKFNKNDRRKFTNKVVTLWYRAPELLLGATQYTKEIDLWAVGCIFFELLTKEALLPGQSEADQLQRIFKLCGTPTEQNWPGVSMLSAFSEDFETMGNTFESRFAQIENKDAVDLLKHLLQIDPRNRWDAARALEHNFFFKDGETPSQTKLPEELPRLAGTGMHEYELKQERARKKKERENVRAAQIGRRASGSGYLGGTSGSGYRGSNRGGFRGGGRGGSGSGYGGSYRGSTSGYRSHRGGYRGGRGHSGQSRGGSQSGQSRGGSQGHSNSSSHHQRHHY